MQSLGKGTMASLKAWRGQPDLTTLLKELPIRVVQHWNVIEEGVLEFWVLFTAQVRRKEARVHEPQWAPGEYQCQDSMLWWNEAGGSSS